MSKKDQGKTGGHALLEKYGPKYFSKLSKSRWAKVAKKSK